MTNTNRLWKVLGALLVVNEKMDERVAYDLAKALATNIDKLRAAHSSFKDITPQFLASQQVIPYHPGAEKFHREAGLLK